jgi:hypothetical protein
MMKDPTMAIQDNYLDGILTKLGLTLNVAAAQHNGPAY